MTEFFTSAALRATIERTRRGTRDLSNPSNAAYYRQDRRIPAAEVAERAAASAAFRQSAGLRPLPTAEITQQIGDGGGRSLFLQLMNGAGLESEFVDDIRRIPAGDQIPKLGDRSTFAATKASSGSSLSVKAIREGLQQIQGLADRLPTGDETLHLIEEPQPAIADDDTVVGERLEKMWDYLRALLS